MPKALIVVTSVSKYDKEPKATGLWLGEAVHFYEKLVKAGREVDFVSPLGGYTPIDPVSLSKDFMTEADWHYYADATFRHKIGATLKPSEVKTNDYQCIYYAGGHGVVWDFPENKEIQQIAENIYNKGGFVSSVCHGAVGLFHIKDEKGETLIKGKEVTGFSNEEERMVGVEKLVPYLTEDELVKHGGRYVKAEKAFDAFAVADGRLITGQNPASAGAVAELVLKHSK